MSHPTSQLEEIARRWLCIRLTSNSLENLPVLYVQLLIWAHLGNRTIGWN